MAFEVLSKEKRYQNDMNDERADNLFRGAHDITFGRIRPINNGGVGRNRSSESMISVRGSDDGTIYTGLASRYKTEEAGQGMSRVQLSFIFGPEQDCRSLDTKMLAYGFKDISKS